MTDRRLCAAFYLSRGDSEPVEHLASAAGVADVSIRPWAVLGVWADMACECIRLPMEFLDALLITFREDDFEAQRPGSEKLDEDPALNVARTFGDACLRLEPDGAFLTAHAWTDPQLYVMQQEQSVLDGDIDDLVRELPALLRLAPHQIDLVHEANGFTGRDTMSQSDGGLLLFHGTGKNRWRRG